MLPSVRGLDLRIIFKKLSSQTQDVVVGVGQATIVVHYSWKATAAVPLSLGRRIWIKCPERRQRKNKRGTVGQSDAADCE